MTNLEFSNEFDVLYNNITSNQAPGLDEYEKSVFLTKAQDEIVKAYFNPRTNKVQEGFDGNERRQIDFSMIMRSKVYQTIKVRSGAASIVEAMPLIIPPIKLTRNITAKDKFKITKSSDTDYTVGDLSTYLSLIDTLYFNVEKIPSGEYAYVTPFVSPIFDMRDETKSILLDDDILMFINEYVEVERASNNKTVKSRLIVVPIKYTEYSRLMSKPYKRPLKNQAWRLLDTSDGYKKSEIVVGPNDSITKYVVRYIKRPRAIRLTDFDDVTLDGEGTEQSCELDPILHPEILQRAVELAKAAYTGDLSSQVALGQTSQTNIGMVTQSN